MNNTIINISSCTATEKEINELEVLINKELQKETLQIKHAKSFNGVSDVILILSSVGGVAIINQIGKIIIQWVKNNENKKIKYGEIEISGYSSKEASLLINSIKDNE
ncbi:MAG: hypothetical protein ACI81I_001043 [Arcobacteraceae bacterium]|jgi:hypothetical protein